MGRLATRPEIPSRMRCCRRASAAAEIGLDGKRDREDEPELLVRVDPREESPADTPHEESVDAGGEGLTGGAPEDVGTSTASCAAASLPLARLPLSAASFFSAVWT